MWKFRLIEINGKEVRACWECGSTEFERKIYPKKNMEIMKCKKCGFANTRKI